MAEVVVGEVGGYLPTQGIHSDVAQIFGKVRHSVMHYHFAAFGINVEAEHSFSFLQYWRHISESMHMLSGITGPSIQCPTCTFTCNAVFYLGA